MGPFSSFPTLPISFALLRLLHFWEVIYFDFVYSSIPLLFSCLPCFYFPGLFPLRVYDLRLWPRFGAITPPSSLSICFLSRHSAFGCPSVSSK